MLNNTKELTLFDEFDFIEKIETLMSGYESAEVEFKSAKEVFLVVCGKLTLRLQTRKEVSLSWV